MRQMVVGPPPTALWIVSGIVVGIPLLIMVKRLSNTGQPIKFNLRNVATFVLGGVLLVDAIWVIEATAHLIDPNFVDRGF